MKATTDSLPHLGVIVPPTAERILEVARRRGTVSSGDVRALGIHTEYLSRLYHAGALERVERGLYALPDAGTSEHRDLVVVARRVPRAVVCLISALHFHGLTTQLPYQVWIAIDGKGRTPRLSYPPLRIVRFSGPLLAEGVQVHELEGVPVRITNPARTVADCFRYRNKIGLDVAIEALRDCWRQRRCTMDDLTYYARICRVATVMRPYLESLV